MKAQDNFLNIFEFFNILYFKRIKTNFETDFHKKYNSHFLYSAINVFIRYSITLQSISKKSNFFIYNGLEFSSLNLTFDLLQSYADIFFPLLIFSN